MTGTELILVDERDDRVVITLNDPARRNAISAAMVHALHTVVERLEAEAPKVLILTGTGGAFAAGADIAELRDRDRLDALSGINLRLFERLRNYPFGTIAAIDGVALGGGAELSYACDVRLATARSVFGQPEPLLGIMAAAGGCFRLSAIVGEGLARDMLLTGRRLSGAEALAAGLVTRLADPEDLLPAAHGVADDMQRSSHLALRLTKLALNADPAAHPALDLAAQALLYEDPEKHERMSSFLGRAAQRPETAPVGGAS